MVARILLLTTILSAAAQGSGSIYGRVTVVDTGAVAAHAKVSATCPADGDSVSATTDGKGAYSLDVPANRCVLMVQHRGKDSTKTALRVSGRTRANLELRRRPGGSWLLVVR